MIRSLRKLHRWAGLLLALPLILQGVTGLVLAVDPLVAGVDAPLASGAPVSGDPSVQIVGIVAAARREAATGLVPRRYRAATGEAAVVGFAQAGSQMAVMEVVVDPASMLVLGIREATGGFDRWVHRLHETLLLGLLGRGIVGWIGIGLLILGLSGIPLWWPSPGRWGASVTVTRRSRGVRLLRELHGAAGFWVVGLLLFQSVSGAALAFPQTARALAGVTAPARQPPRGDRVSGPIDATPVLAVAVAAALRAAPDAELQELRLPADRARPIVAFLVPHGAWPGAPGAVVTLDPASGRVLSVQDPRTQGFGPWLLGWLRSLHYGAGLGLAWRLVICAAGLCLPLFPVTGAMMWWLRRRNRRSQAMQRTAALLDATP